MEEFDLDLLLSVAGGLGRWQDYGNKRVYVKDEDSLGEHSSSSHVQAARLSSSGAGSSTRAVWRLLALLPVADSSNGHVLAAGHASRYSTGRTDCPGPAP